MIVSDTVFLWFVTTVVVLTCSSWLTVEIVRLRRALAEPGNPHDRIFGAICSASIMIIGLIAITYHHLR